MTPLKVAKMEASNPMLSVNKKSTILIIFFFPLLSLPWHMIQHFGFLLFCQFSLLCHQGVADQTCLSSMEPGGGWRICTAPVNTHRTCSTYRCSSLRKQRFLSFFVTIRISRCTVLYARVSAIMYNLDLSHVALQYTDNHQFCRFSISTQRQNSTVP